MRPNTGILIGNSSTTVQGLLNNLTRAVIGTVCSALSGGMPMVYPPYDEPLGPGYSLESQQLSEDAFRIIHHESKLCEVVDPLRRFILYGVAYRSDGGRDL